MKQIYYHSHCVDGITGAAAIKIANEANPHPDILEFYPISYDNASEKLKNVTGTIVFIDFCPSIQDIQDMLDRGCKVLILDHHTTAKKAIMKAFEPHTDEEIFLSSEGELRPVFKDTNKLAFIIDMNISGAVLGWMWNELSDLASAISAEETYDSISGLTRWADHLGPEVITRGFSIMDYVCKRDNMLRTIPDAIRHVMDNDIWTHKDPMSKYFSLGLRDSPGYVNNDIEAAAALLWDTIDGKSGPGGEYHLVLTTGKTIYNHKMTQVARLRAMSTVVTDYQKPATKIAVLANVEPGLVDYFSEAIISEGEFPLVICYSDDWKKRHRKYSLRSARGFDCRVMAERHGGGGHPTACSFIEPFGRATIFDIEDIRLAVLYLNYREWFEDQAFEKQRLALANQD